MKPLKRIGEEVQYKKLKGNYLYYFAGIALVSLVIIVIFLNLAFQLMFKMIAVGLLFILLSQILKSFQKKSTEDYYIDIRKRCQKSNFRIEGEIIKSIPHD